MSLSTGTRVGGYEVISRIGAGGMGEVYLARDTTLDRRVALKLLPADVADDPERLARFEREAKTLASLNHPHIAQIYGVVSTGGARAIVMELVEGEDLAARLQRGPLPLDEALVAGRQIADALEAAHNAGVVHRDLKPANVKVRPDGTVKVLDFGLAKIAAASGSDPAMINSPTITSPVMTHAGVILGTAAYMAPEQARGRVVDKRADIWAFGCLLFEMLTGRRLFDGEDVSEMLASVLRTEPAWPLLPAATPEPVRRLLRRCLVREPRNRLPDIGVARLEIDDAMAGAQPAPTSRRSSRTWIVALSTATAGAVLGAAAALQWRGAATAATPERTVQIASDPGIASQRLSPDGRRVAFVRDDRLVVTSIETGEANELAGTDGAANPFWSPDSSRIAYYRLSELGWELRVIPAGGGTSRVLVRGAQGSSTALEPWPLFGGTWCSAGLVFYDGNTRLVRMVSEANGETLSTFNNPENRGTLAYPSCLSDGRILAVRRTPGKAEIVVAGPAHATVLHERPISNPTDVRYPVLAGSSHIVFEQADPNQGLWALPVSSDLSSASGAPQLLLPAASRPSSSAGMLSAITGVLIVERQMVWVDRNGRELSRFGKPQREFRTVSVSPDLRQVISGGRRGMEGRLWLHGPDTVTPWLDEQSGWPAWSPDGRSIAYVGQKGVTVRSANGANPRVLVDRGSGPTWTPRSDGLVFFRGTPDAVLFVPVTAGAEPRVLIENAREASISPNGKLIAFASDRTGRSEVYVTTFPDTGKLTMVSADGGRYPRWTNGSNELFFACGRPIADDPQGARAMCVAGIDPQSGDRTTAPRSLFDALALGLRLVTFGERGYDIAPDGSRVLLQTAGNEGRPTITLVQNVEAWLRRRAQ